MKDSKKNVPLERKTFEVEINGTTQAVGGVDRVWVDVKKRNFTRYIPHPIPINGEFVSGEKEAWLELMYFVALDLEWLLQQKHHIFWSHMIFSKEAQQLLITFLQEAPPTYLRHEFPKDKQMEHALEQVEHLTFLVFVRLSTERESDTCYIQNLGELLYNNYIFTVPILLDICLIYGTCNRHLVARMFDDVIGVAPQYLNDFREIVPHFLEVLNTVRGKFDGRELTLASQNKLATKMTEIRDVILYLYDTAETVHTFLDIYANGSRLFRTDTFAGEVASFYSTVIPKIYKFVKKVMWDTFRTWNFVAIVDDIRTDLVSIVGNVFSGIVNDILSDEDRRNDHANEYVTKMMDILHDPLFLSDYNRIRPIDLNLRLLREVCPDVDSENLRYISEAIAPLNETWPSAKKGTPSRVITGVELASLVTQVKDILPYLGDGFVEACLSHYDYDAERVVAALLEDRLPPELDRLDRNLTAWCEPEKPSPAAQTCKRASARNEETLNLLNAKTDLNEMRDKFAQFSMIPVDGDYDDEYDDTYDDRDVSIRGADDADRERRPFVTPRILRSKEEDAPDDQEEDEGEGEDVDESKNDWSLPNPAEIRARQEQKRMESTRRDYVGRGRGRGQSKQVLANRDFKDTHKSSMANHNRRKLASRKRNIPLLN